MVFDLGDVNAPRPPPPAYDQRDMTPVEESLPGKVHFVGTPTRNGQSPVIAFTSV